MWGLTEADYAKTVPLWPENAQAFALFVDMSTQWRAGQSGIIGLDYNVLYREMDRMKLSDDEYDELLDDVRTMEWAALDEMRKD